jgi:hypothetical protein
MFSKHEAIVLAEDRAQIEGVPVYIYLRSFGFQVTTESQDDDLLVYTAWPFSVKVA